MDGSPNETVIGVTEFKAKCLAIIDAVAKRKTNRVVLIKRDRPVALIVPCDAAPPSLWGALRGTVMVAPGVDLTDPTGDHWSVTEDGGGDGR